MASTAAVADSRNVWLPSFGIDIPDPLVHGNEPLRRRAEDDRRAMTPTVRIAVLKLLRLQQHPVHLQFVNNRLVGLPYREPTDERHLSKKAAVIAHRVFHRQTVFLPYDVVIHAVCRRGVHRSGPGFHRHVIPENDRYLPLIEGVLQQNIFKLAPGTSSDSVGAVPIDTIALQCAVQPAHRRGASTRSLYPPRHNVHQDSGLPPRLRATSRAWLSR